MACIYHTNCCILIPKPKGQFKHATCTSITQQLLHSHRWTKAPKPWDVFINIVEVFDWTHLKQRGTFEIYPIKSDGQCSQARISWLEPYISSSTRIVPILSKYDIGNREKEGNNKYRAPRQSCLVLQFFLHITNNYLFSYLNNVKTLSIRIHSSSK